MQKRGRMMLCPLYLFLGIDDENTRCTNQETDTSNDHHCRLMVTHQREYGTATDSSHNLGYTDGTIKQTKVGTHVSVALQGIGNKRKRHSQHCCPSAANEQEGDDL